MFRTKFSMHHSLRRPRKLTTKQVFSSVSLLLVLLIATQINGQSKKLSPQEIITKHLASMGSLDDLSVAKRRMVIAGSEFFVRSGTTKANGRAVLASDGDNLALFSTFNLSDYRMERIGIFSDKLDIPFIVPGRRSPLGRWLIAYDRTVNDRIFGGSIFSTWLFLKPDTLWGKMETEGKKKVGDREAWVINYSPKQGLKAGSYIKLYFDTENFHHLRTVYKQMETERGFYDTGSKGSNIGSTGHMDDSAMANNQSTLTENFEEFLDDNGLVLPRKYSINLQMESAAGTAEYDWIFKIEEYRLIKQFPVNFFTFQKDVIP
jgi:hypothetical protein